MVYVLNKNGRPLMPCSSRKARMLLSAGKAAVAGCGAAVRGSSGTRRGIKRNDCDEADDDPEQLQGRKTASRFNSGRI